MGMVFLLRLSLASENWGSETRKKGTEETNIAHLLEMGIDKTTCFVLCVWFALHFEQILWQSRLHLCRILTDAMTTWPCCSFEKPKVVRKPAKPTDLYPIPSSNYLYTLNRSIFPSADRYHHFSIIFGPRVQRSLIHVGLKQAGVSGLWCIHFTCYYHFQNVPRQFNSKFWRMHQTVPCMNAEKLLIYSN